jgi:hypothetical protein
MFKEIIAFYTKNHMKFINAPWGQNAALLNVKAGGIYSYHWGLKG